MIIYQKTHGLSKQKQVVYHNNSEVPDLIIHKYKLKVNHLSF